MNQRMKARLSASAVLAIAVMTLAPLTQVSASPVRASASSAVTVDGSGDFSALQVTVAQTRNLLDQVVEISWEGATPTQPGSGQYAIDYLQIMQCWGDDPAGPDRAQCQYGGLTGDSRGGAQTASRQVNYGSNLIDPLENLKPAVGSLSNVYVPFQSVTGKTTDQAVNEFYDGSTTNEVPYAQTRVDGTGREYFNVQTLRDAPGLGCGEPIDNGTSVKGRSCWLVVVPRSSREVDGSVRTISTSDQLVSSPLSQTNWNNRLVVKLQFEPAGQPCPLGRSERKTVGHEQIAEAILRWQPKLCEGKGAVYSYSQVSDETARRELKSDDPGLVYVSKPLEPGSVPSTTPAVYAPVGVSGLTIAFNIESQSPFRASPDIKQRDGQRITSLKLTPRLVAKLLTQSYRRAVDVEAPSVTTNPLDMTKDPDFKQINPQFDGLSISLSDLLLPAGRSDAISTVWKWLESDPEAAAFIKGTPDPWGMKVNPNYKGMRLDRDDYPKSDPFCRSFVDARPKLCTLDAHPYAADMGSAARAAARGDGLARSNWDPNAEPPSWKKGAVQPTGTRALMALVDTASAERFGLVTAAIRNANGEFVKPTTTSMSAALTGATLNADKSVLVVNPAYKNDQAYPLTQISYAATVPAALSGLARADYATLLTYAAAGGQTFGLEPGELPAGYAPMSAALRAKTVAVAAQIKNYKPPAAPSEQTVNESSAADTGTANPVSVETLMESSTNGSLTVNTANTSLIAATVNPFGQVRFVPALILLLSVVAGLGGAFLIRLGRA